MKSWQLAVILLLVIAVGIPVGFFFANQFGFLATGGAVVVQEQAPGLPTTACLGGETQSLDLNSYDVDAPTTSLTESNNIFRECGSTGSLGSLTEGTALTGLQTGACYEFIYGVSGTASNLYDNAYGPHIKITSLPCRMTKNIPLFQDELEGSITGTFYNSNHDASAETLVANTPVTVYVKLYGADKEYYGNPYIGEPTYLRNDWETIKQSGITYLKGQPKGQHRPEFPNTVCLQLNTTDHREPKWVKAKLQDGSIVEMNRVSTPTIHSVAAGHKDYCYEAPIISGTPIELQIKVDPKAVATTDDVLKYYASSWWMHTDTGEISWGSEDNDGNAVGASDPVSVTLDWT